MTIQLTKAKEKEDNYSSGLKEVKKQLAQITLKYDMTQRICKKTDEELQQKDDLLDKTQLECKIATTKLAQCE